MTDKKEKKKVVPSATPEARRRYERENQTPMIESPDWETASRFIEESVAILSRKIRKKLRTSNTTLDKDIRQVREIVRMWSQISEQKLKQAILESKDSLDIPKLTQNILNISSDDLRKALQKPEVEDAEVTEASTEQKQD